LRGIVRGAKGTGFWVLARSPAKRSYQARVEPDGSFVLSVPIKTTFALQAYRTSVDKQWVPYGKRLTGVVSGSKGLVLERP